MSKDDPRLQDSSRRSVDSGPDLAIGFMVLAIIAGFAIYGAMFWKVVVGK